MLYNLLKLSHVLSIVVWVGGMVFAHFFLRPAIALLDPPQRVRLMHAVLSRFLGAVVVVAAVAWGSGMWMIGLSMGEVAQTGGVFRMPLAWTAMSGAGTLMVAIFGHIRWVLFRRLDRAVAAGDWPAGAVALAAIRQWVVVNLILGLGIIAIMRLM